LKLREVDREVDKHNMVEVEDLYLFLISASLRPSLGVSTVRAMALNPALSALLTS